MPMRDLSASFVLSCLADFHLSNFLTILDITVPGLFLCDLFVHLEEFGWIADVCVVGGCVLGGVALLILEFFIAEVMLKSRN